MLTSFHIKNFRSCKDVKIEDMGPMLGLVGRNGAGKTTILRAIEWVARTALTTMDFSERIFEAALGGSPSPRAEVEFQLDDTEYRYTVGLEFEITADQNGMKFGRDVESLCIKSPDSLRWVSLFARNDDVVALADRAQQIELNILTGAMPALASLLPEADALQSHLHRVMRFLRDVHYYLGQGVFDPAYPIVIEQNGPIPKAAYDKWAAAQSQFRGHYPSLLLRLIHAHETESDVFAELKDRLGPDGLGLLGDIRVISLEVWGGSGQGRGYYDVEFVPSGQDVGLPFSQLSGGTRQMLSLMMALLLDRRSVMLVEQPEDGVHLALLGKLLDIFRVNADPTQIILTSHSPKVLSSLEPADVRLVEMRDGSTRVRALTAAEVSRAQDYTQRDGSLAEFLELIQED